MTKSIREIIASKADSLKNMDSIGPHDIADEVVELAALWSSINKEVGDAIWVYNIKKLQCLKDNENIAAKAKIHAEASDEWKEMNDRILAQKTVIELIRACKYYLRNSLEEKRESVY